jgi:NAD-dependent deacetylase
VSKQKKIVVFTGAGISAESGIKTFRDSGGLWEEYRIEDVATPEAWRKNPSLVLDFYNQRRKQIIEAQPNDAHKRLAELQKHFDVLIITQNIDDLHERAGSKKVLHLHGEIMKSRSSLDPRLVYPVKKGVINLGDKCEKGSQLRPNIVWFGEMVPNMDLALSYTHEADIFVTIGTSLNVYPAAGLLEAALPAIPKYLIDPGDFNLDHVENLVHIKQKAVDGTKQLFESFLAQH